MKKLIAFMLLSVAMLIPLSTFSTCIIIIKTRSGDVYIVADRIEGYTNGQPPTLTCKIFQHGSYYYAIAGFNPDSIIEYFNKALDQLTSFQQKLNYFISKIQSADSNLV